MNTSILIFKTFPIERDTVSLAFNVRVHCYRMGGFKGITNRIKFISNPLNQDVSMLSDRQNVMPLFIYKIKGRFLFAIKCFYFLSAHVKNNLFCLQCTF